jgi:dTDP-4-amino-4,6-dideoxygalactose transaminase
MLVLDERFDRSTIIQHLAHACIEAGAGSVAAHLGAHFQPQPALPVSEKLHHHGLALPLHAGLTAGQVGTVVENLCKNLGHDGPARSSSQATPHPLLKP